MYSKHEASLLNQEFWTTLGQYMAPIKSFEGEKINWINYKTGVRNIRFVLTAENKVASVTIELTHKDPVAHEAAYEKLILLKAALEQTTGVSWAWEKMITDAHDRLISMISLRKPNVSVLNKSDWPELISFFKNHLVSLDAFWCENKFIFEI